MASTSPEQRDKELFAEIERLADEFDPRLCDHYSDHYAQVFAHTLGLDADELRARYERVRLPRPVSQQSPKTVFVLSRVTLGADVAVTSVLMDAARRRFPSAGICFAGPRKNAELFSGTPLLEVSYPRSGTLPERLSVWHTLREQLSRPDAIVLDPDSRLTQLGLLPVCGEDHYYFFESRAYGGDGEDSLVTLARRWCGEVLGVPDAAPWIAPAPSQLEAAVTVSLGVGENPAKRIGGPFEAEMLRMLAARFPSVLVDTGAGGEERDRVLAAVDQSGAANIRTWVGPFAPFADAIRRGRLYVGYDSAGQHVAAACGVPLITVFAGFVSPRMFARWYPTGPGPIQVIRVDNPDPQLVLERFATELGTA